MYTIFGKGLSCFRGVTLLLTSFTVGAESYDTVILLYSKVWVLKLSHSPCYRPQAKLSRTVNQQKIIKNDVLSLCIAFYILVLQNNSVSFHGMMTNKKHLSLTMYKAKYNLSIPISLVEMLTNCWF